MEGTCADPLQYSQLESSVGYNGKKINLHAHAGIVKYCREPMNGL